MDSPQAIEEIKPSPSERLLREILRESMSDRAPISDVIVIWTDTDGVQHMRSAQNERLMNK